jgi:hypothetical protein
MNEPFVCYAAANAGSLTREATNAGSLTRDRPLDSKSVTTVMTVPGTYLELSPYDYDKYRLKHYDQLRHWIPTRSVLQTVA